MTSLVLALSLAYTAVAALLLTLNLGTRFGLGIKGAAIGAVGGMLLGALISPLFPSKRTVSCQDPDDPSLRR